MIMKFFQLTVVFNSINFIYSYRDYLFDQNREGFGLIKAAMLGKDTLYGLTECPLQACPDTPCASLQNCPNLPSPPIKDKCNCCFICPSLEGQTCDVLKPCDESKNLKCINGVCVQKQSRQCYLDRHVYNSGQSFNISCTMTCKCMDGHLGCSPRCQLEPPPLESNCNEAILVRKRRECCRHWMCLDEVKIKSPRRYDKLIAQAKKDPHAKKWEMGGEADHAYVIAVNRMLRKDGCMIQTSEWTDCSRVCGWGLSERITNDNPKCQMTREVRLCQSMPCVDRNLVIDDGGSNDDQIIRIERSDRSEFGTSDNNNPLIDMINKENNKNKRCQRLRKSNKRVRFSFDGCMSSKLFRPRYCGTCRDNRCCQPSKIKTVDVQFRCVGGDHFNYKIAMIRTCKCSRECGVTSMWNVGTYLGSDGIDI